MIGVAILYQLALGLVCVTGQDVGLRTFIGRHTVCVLALSLLDKLLRVIECPILQLH